MRQPHLLNRNNQNVISDITAHRQLVTQGGTRPLSSSQLRFDGTDIAPEERPRGITVSLNAFAFINELSNTTENPPSEETNSERSESVHTSHRRP